MTEQFIEGRRGREAIERGLDQAVRAPVRTERVVLAAGGRAGIRIEPYGREEIQLATDWQRWPGYNGDEIDGLSRLGWIHDQADGTYFNLCPAPFRRSRTLDLIVSTLAVYAVAPEDVEVDVVMRWDR